MKLWKRWFVALMAGVTITATLPTNVFASEILDGVVIETYSSTADEVASGTCGDNITWVLDEEGVLTISGEGGMCEVTTSADVPWKDYKENITSVVIYSGVTNICKMAFYGCTSLTDITLPDSLTSIGYGAFYECTSLKDITLPDSLTSIGGWAFYNCISLTDIIFPDSLTSIDSYAFRRCTSLTDITLPNSITSIEDATFMTCTSLTNIQIPDSLQSIGNLAFYGCESLVSISLPDSLKSIGDYAFEFCTSLTDITIPGSVLSVGINAFYGCTSLGEVNIPDGLMLMEDGSYQSVTTVTLSGTREYDMAYEALELINEERAAEGLSALTMDEDLLEAAMQRAAEISIYFDHTRPSSLSATTVSSKVSGENIAGNYPSSQSVVEGWMNSSGHKENILRSGFVSTGIGCFVHNGIVYWVQLFGNQNADEPEEDLSGEVSTTASVDVVYDTMEDNFYLSPTALSIGIGDSIEESIKATNPEWSIMTANINLDGFKWESDNTSVAIVDDSGLVTGIGEGSATITAENGWISISVPVTVVADIDSCYGTSISLSDITATNTGEGLQVTFNAVTGTTLYNIKYKKNQGQTTFVQQLSDVAGNISDDADSYTVKIASTKDSGNTYTIWVVAYTPTSTVTTGTVSIMYLSQPEISLLGSRAEPTITWEAVTGAEEYYIYRKTVDSDWVVLGSSEETSFTDTTADANTIYYYTVQAASGVYRSSSDMEGVSTSTLEDSDDSDTDSGNNEIDGTNDSSSSDDNSSSDSTKNDSGNTDSSIVSSGVDSLCVRRGNAYYFSYTIHAGDADKVIYYGRTADEVLVGDWDGDGVDTICVRRGNTYYFSNSLKSGNADQVIYYGKATDEVLVGDWDGDGKDTLAVRRGNTYYISNTIKSGNADKVVYYGKATDTVFTGDWDGDGIDTLTVRRGNAYYISNTIKSGNADKVVYYGKATDSVLVGDWDGDGDDTLAVRRGNTYYISNAIKSGNADKVVPYGKATDEVYAGTWK